MTDENKPIRYLKYAIGEIVLVVLGILIALQINDANDRRKTESVKQNYYKQIVVDLDAEIANISGRIGYLDTCITAFKDYNIFISGPDHNLAEVFVAITKVPVVLYTLSFNTNTIQTLESTGEIKLIPEDLRNRLTTLKRDQERIIKTANSNYDMHLNSFKKAMELGYLRLALQRPKVEGLVLDENISEIIVTLEAGLTIKDFTDTRVLEYLHEMLVEIDEIKEMIAMEMDGKD